MRLAILFLLSFVGILRCAVADVPFIAGFARFDQAGGSHQQLLGELLLTELSCTACHVTDHRHLQPKLGPRLDSVALRLQNDWIRGYLSDPAQLQPGTTMPHLLSHLEATEKEQAIEALVAFLSTLNKPWPEIKASGTTPVPHEFWKQGNVDRGRDLYHRIGCVACHEADPRVAPQAVSVLDQMIEQLEPEDLVRLGLDNLARPTPSVPLNNIGDKYTAFALAYFLHDPLLARPSARMPNLKLTAVESADIAAYLMFRFRSAVPVLDTPKSSSIKKVTAADGAKLFVQLRCVQCHEVRGYAAEFPARRLDRINQFASTNCLDGNRSSLPQYGLDVRQRDLLKIALNHQEKKNDSSLAGRESLISLSLIQQNCLACHQRGKLGGLGRGRERYFETAGQMDLGDEGRLPPPLTKIGAKLQPNWMKKVLLGSGDIRPYLQIRMPKYSESIAGSITRELGEADSADLRADRSDFDSQPALIEAGRNLLDVGCIQCHPIRGHVLPGVAGIDLSKIGERLQPTWFKQFLLDPVATKPRTRMPTFFAKGSENREILSGNVDRQIAAIWHYLQDDTSELPNKIEQMRTRSSELVPQERPIILRTFMAHAGTHAIAVGLPSQVHFAFDAEQVRLACLWKGRFIDAQGTWFDRFSPPAGPLGNSLIRFAPGPEFVQSSKPPSTWPTTSDIEFRGFSLDVNGVPTFRYSVGEVEIRDRIEAGGEGELQRVVRLTANGQAGSAVPLWFRAIAGKSLVKSAHSRTNEAGLCVTVLGNAINDAVYRDRPDEQAWLIPWQATQTESTLHIKYSWK